MQDVDFAIVGRGMIGAAAARHLSQMAPDARIALVGPLEPAVKATHPGVFGSHYDEGRITRTIDPDPVWALLGQRSIARYGEIEAQSGLSIYTECGALLVGPAGVAGDTFVDRIWSAAATVGARADRLGDAALRDRFPFLSFEAGSEGIHEPKGAGMISPRRLVAAQALLAARQGVTLIEDHALSVRERGEGVEIRLAGGETLRAGRVLVATGAFFADDGLLAEKPPLKMCARTITFFEVDAAEAARLAAMPSIISKPRDPAEDVYVLPPVRYPDGRLLAKIGGGEIDRVIDNGPDMAAWFRTAGDAAVSRDQIRIFRAMLPGVRIAETSTGACVTTYTADEKPLIRLHGSDRIAIAADGKGGAAKSSDEIGRLAAELVLEGRVTDPAYGPVF